MIEEENINDKASDGKAAESRFAELMEAYFGDYFGEGNYSDVIDYAIGLVMYHINNFSGVAPTMREGLDRILGDPSFRCLPLLDSLYRPFKEEADARAWLAHLHRELFGDMEEEIALFSSAIGLNPRDATTWFKRGNARRACGDSEGAISDFNRAIELDPKYAHALNSRGLAREDLGDCDGAVADYNRAIEHDPMCATAWFNRGNVSREKGDLDAAIADYTRAIELDPEYNLAFCYRSFAKRAKGDWEGAEADLKHCRGTTMARRWVYKASCSSLPAEQ